MSEIKIPRKDMIDCALCKDAPCSSVCPKLDPAGLLRSVWFENEAVAASHLPEDEPCRECAAPCEEKCVRAGKVPVKDLICRLYDKVRPGIAAYTPGEGNRLRIGICGIPLENPFLLSSSAVSSTYDMCARAFEAGWAGAVFKTVCSFDIHEASPRFSAVPGDAGGFIGFKNIEQLSDKSVDENMDTVRRLKEDYPDKAVIVSMMGQNEAEWAELAHACQEAGADAVELNFSCPNMADGGLGSDIGQIPELVETFTAAAKRGCSIPVLAKLTPNTASMKEAAEAAKKGGADGLAAINTIKSIMGVSPETFVSSPDVNGMSAVGGYSGNAVKPIALRFISELAHDEKLSGMHISGIGGIETWRDALEFILLGAGSLQITTAVMKYGYRIIEDLNSGLDRFLAEKGYANVSELTGRALPHVSDTTDVLERDTVVFPMFNRDKCIGCGRCMISCSDGGHQALSMNEERRIVMDGKKCVGCHLCVLVCPGGAISAGSKRIKR